MDGERRETLRRKYLNLGIGELGAVIVFCGIAMFSVVPALPEQRDAIALWSALTPLLVILVQAGAYWLLARSWVERAPMPKATANVYRAFRVLDVLVLLLGLAGMLIWFPSSIAWGIVFLAVWLFGVIEYVNYFVARLAYPVSRWFSTVGEWRIPRLMQDVAGSR